MGVVDPELLAAQQARTAQARTVELEETISLDPILRSVEVQYPDMPTGDQVHLAAIRRRLEPVPEGLEYGKPLPKEMAFEINQRRWYHRLWDGIVAFVTVPIFFILDIFGVRTRRRERLVSEMNEGREVLAEQVKTGEAITLPSGLIGLAASSGNWEKSEHVVELTAEEQEAARGMKLPGFRVGNYVELPSEEELTAEEQQALVDAVSEVQVVTEQND